jgi:hypothetical protein
MDRIGIYQPANKARSSSPSSAKTPKNILVRFGCTMQDATPINLERDQESQFVSRDWTSIPPNRTQMQYR